MLVPYRKDTHLVKGCVSFHDIKKHYVVIDITTTYYSLLRKMYKN